jgi:hypothetical protein
MLLLGQDLKSDFSRAVFVRLPPEGCLASGV